MRRRQINAQRAQEVAVTITETVPMGFIPVRPTFYGTTTVECPNCHRVMKASGGATAHIRNCKGDV